MVILEHAPLGHVQVTTKMGTIWGISQCSCPALCARLVKHCTVFSRVNIVNEMRSDKSFENAANV